MSRAVRSGAAAPGSVLTRVEHAGPRRGPTAQRPARRRASAAYDRRVIVIASEFNRPITHELLRGASGALRSAGIPTRNIEVFWVPGAFELPAVAARAARRSPRPDAIIALGALIRGQTAQYEVIANAVASGLSQLAVSEVLPVTFGLIVAETLAQAKARAGGALGNRGAEAAHAAVAVLRLFDRLEPEPS